jgi:molybdopterin synthase catalytic subunit
MVELTKQPIDTELVLREVRSPHAGAVVLFLGTAREFTASRQTVSLYYECYDEMALRLLTAVKEQVERGWPILRCAIVHRVGHVPVGEASVAIAVSSAHREQAFAAGQWVIDTIKTEVPIWKKENWADGTSQWVHPGDPGPNPSMP